MKECEHIYIVKKATKKGEYNRFICSKCGEPITRVPTQEEWEKAYGAD